MYRLNPVISVIGLGRLGLPLACVFVEAGYRVIGVDKSEDIVDAVNGAHSVKIHSGFNEQYTKNILTENTGKHKES